MFSAASSRSASSNTITGALPPSSRCTRLTSSAAALATAMPAPTLPVIDAIAGVGWLTSAAPVSRSPQTTLNTPGGRNSAISSAIQTVLAGRRVGRLEHHRVAGRERGRPLPDGHHRRVVPRRHRRADADRLAPDERGEAAHVLARRLALEHAGGAGEEADLVAHRRHLLVRRQLRGLPVFCDSTATSSSARSSIASAIRSSARWRSLGVVSRHSSNARAASWNAASTSASPRQRGGREHLAGAGIDQLGRLAVGGGDPLAVDEVGDLDAHRSSCD